MAKFTKGYQPSPEVRAKLSKSHLGVPLSAEHRKNIGLAHLGKKRSAEARKRISASKIGAKNPMYGKRPSQEVRKKLSDAAKKYWGPRTDYVEALKAKIKVKQKDGMFKVILNPFGLGDKAEERAYYTKTQSCVSKEIGDNEHVHINLMTLDDYVRENDIKMIDYIKIDAEGFDYKIIQGGANTIKDKVRHIQFEYWSGVRRFLPLLKGFELSLMLEPVLELALRKYAEIPDGAYLAALDDKLIDTIDNKLIPMGVGGNIFGEKL